MEMVTVKQAEDLVNAQFRDYGCEKVNGIHANGRVLAENLVADRDAPPFHRSTVDGIGIAYRAIESGLSQFKIIGVQAAGEVPVAITKEDQCIEIMTGAAIDTSIDTIIRYEDIDIAGQQAVLKDIKFTKGQNIHRRGVDHQKGDTIVNTNNVVTPVTIGLAASIGKTELLVKKPPRTMIITTGDELVSADRIPNDFQLRQSNGVTVSTVIQQYGISADTLHLKDDFGLIKQELDRCLATYDVIIMCGGVSMGKFDYIPEVLADLGAKAHFRKVKQKPGKPFWFGSYGDHSLIFAFPGNPVSVFLCLHRYFIPWLRMAFGLAPKPLEYAILKSTISAPFAMQYFAQVKLSIGTEGEFFAENIKGNGSGDFSNLIHADAFIELPMDRNEFHAGEVYRIWRYNL